MEDGNWEIYPIIRLTVDSKTAFQVCRWSWVPRLANMAADFLALHNGTGMSASVWVDRRPPSMLVHVLNKDGLPPPPAPLAI